MLNAFTKTETKIAVLEERLTSYEVMMKKIDEAIQIMGKTSQSISKMLAVHEEKLDQSTKSDLLIVSMIDDMKRENKSDHNEVQDKIKQIEDKLEEFVKFRWLLAGGLILTTFVISQSSVVIDILTPNQQPVRLERSK
jgi:chromosome segregation ATPase